jgi:hypothetical protein
MMAVNKPQLFDAKFRRLARVRKNTASSFWGIDIIRPVP